MNLKKEPFEISQNQPTSNFVNKKLDFLAQITNDPLFQRDQYDFDVDMEDCDSSAG